MAEFGDWYKSIPLITRFWFAGSVAVPVCGRLGLVSPMYLILWPAYFFSKFQIWRPITATLYFPLSFKYLVNMYLLYHYSTRLETGSFAGKSADYVFLLSFNWLCIVIAGLLMDMQTLMVSLVMSVLYVWAQLHKETIVSFWFGTRFKACYLPWVIMVFNWVTMGSMVNELIGNLVGHLYYFLMFKYPMDLGGSAFLSTPEFLYRLLPNQRGVAGFGAPPNRRANPEEQPGGGRGRGLLGRHNWGQGLRLGED